MTESATGMDESDEGMLVMAVIVTLFAAMLDGSSRIPSILPASNVTLRKGQPVRRIVHKLPINPSFGASCFTPHGSALKLRQRFFHVSEIGLDRFTHP